MADSPATRAELIEVMAQVSIMDAVVAEHANGTKTVRLMPLGQIGAAHTLAAIEAAGCSVVPNEATTDMVPVDAVLLGQDRNVEDYYETWSAMLAASPFRPPPTPASPTKEG